MITTELSDNDCVSCFANGRRSAFTTRASERSRIGGIRLNNFSNDVNYFSSTNAKVNFSGTRHIVLRLELYSRGHVSSQQISASRGNDIRRVVARFRLRVISDNLRIKGTTNSRGFVLTKTEEVYKGRPRAKNFWYVITNFCTRKGAFRFGRTGYMGRNVLPSFPNWQTI